MLIPTPVLHSNQWLDRLTRLLLHEQFGVPAVRCAEYRVEHEKRNVICIDCEFCEIVAKGSPSRQSLYNENVNEVERKVIQECVEGLWRLHQEALKKRTAAKVAAATVTGYAPELASAMEGR